MLDTTPAGPRRRDLALMLVLTFTTGIVDAVGYLGLDFIFAGNMTGNVLILGMGIGKAADVPVAGPALALVMFGLGAAIGGRLLRGSPRAWGRGTTTAVAVTGAATAAAALLFVVLPSGSGASEPVAVRSVAVALLSGAMGLQAAAARQLGVADVTTVVVTSTLTRLFADLGSGAPGLWARRAGAVVLIGAGAAVGAVLLRVHIAVALGVAAVLVLAVAGVGAAPRRTGSRSAR